MGYMAWLDLETTGSDEDDGMIVEVGIAVCDDSPPDFEILDTFTMVCWPLDANWFEKMDPVVQKMHTDSGLRSEVDAAKSVWPSDVEKAAIEFLKSYAHDDKGQRPMLAGSGVGHFDRRWLKRHMSELEKVFAYPCIDVGVIRRSLRYAGREDLIPDRALHYGTPHRGLDDALDHRLEWITYQRLLAQIGR